MINPNAPFLWHGGDYCPEQWPREMVDEDVRLMQASRVTVATIGMFAWAKMEPSDGKYEFGWLDEVIEKLDKGGRHFILGTPSAAPPAWLSKKYPETLRTGSDRVRRQHGNRVNFNWASPIYQDKVKAVNEQMALRYGKHPKLVAWHLSNEYGGEDYSEASIHQFREWLRVKFEGDLDKLNHAYWAAFWGHTYGNWDEIDAPGHPYAEIATHGLTVDWMRFNTDQCIDFMNVESGPIRKHSPGVPITTNMMGDYAGLDYRRMAKALDFISWDSYPAEKTRYDDPWTWTRASFRHDLMRSLKRDHPWLLMEFSPGTANWYPTMAIKAPGMHRFESLHAVAHGSHGAMYFQWRQGRGGQEQYHGAVVNHGYAGRGRIFDEVSSVGEILEGQPALADSTLKAEVALVFDWENRWAIAAAFGWNREHEHVKNCINLYGALMANGLQVDVIGQDDDLDRYKMVVLPQAYSARPGFAERCAAFVERGGALVGTYQTAWVDQNGLVFENGMLGPFQALFGVRVEEFDQLYPGDKNAISLSGDWGVHTAEADEYCELLEVLPGTETLGAFKSNFYAGRSAVTHRAHGKGHAYYLASRTDQGFNKAFFGKLAQQAGARPLLENLPENVYATLREGKESTGFLMNVGPENAVVRTPRGDVKLGGFEVKIVEGGFAK